jgi:tRNA(fMet)-specific endonuclease VapC
LKCYMLDTNMASYVIKGTYPLVHQRLAAVPMEAVTVSSVTQAELMFGLAKCGRPERLARLIEEFLLRVDVRPWDRTVANTYGELRASCEAAGFTLGALDMMIAAHAVADGAILITRDQAFSRVPVSLTVEDWTKE